MSRQEDERKEGRWGGGQRGQNNMSVCAVVPIVPKNKMKVMDWSLFVISIIHSFQILENVLMAPLRNTWTNTKTK